MEPSVPTKRERRMSAFAQTKYRAPPRRAAQSEKVQDETEAMAAVSEMYKAPPYSSEHPLYSAPVDSKVSVDVEVKLRHSVGCEGLTKVAISE
jgi:hypothetical protein